METNCQFSEPLWIYVDTHGVRFLKTLETAPNNANFEFSVMVCNTPKGIFTIENPTNPEGNFEIQKTYTYGDITTIFALGFIALFLVFYVLKRIFIHEEVKIHSYQTKF